MPTGTLSPVEEAMAPHLSLQQIVWNRFGCLEPCQPGWLDELPYWEDYTAAFFRSNGLEYHARDSNVKGWLEAADRAPFVRMAEVLLTRLATNTVLHDVDFVLVAHWLPDLHLGSSVTNFAMHHLGLDKAFGFAISDRGLSAPFFALDCIDKYLRGGRKKALLMVMDQKHLLYKSGLTEALKPDNTACVMLLERRNGPGLIYLGYRRQAVTSPAFLAQEYLAICDSLSLRKEVTTIIASDGLFTGLGLPGQIRKADPRLVCAAPFVELSDSLVPDRDYLLLTRDTHSIYGIAFRSQGA
jgi:hypothetical protein